jgi:dTMP kinase
MKNIFIVFDGIDKAGKTTQLNLTSQWLQSKNIDFYKTREPGGTVIGEQLRNIFLENDLEPMTELCILSAIRNEHSKILKQKSEKIILCDRFVDSTKAYQGLNINSEIIDFFIKQTTDISPDFVFLFLDQYSKEEENHFDRTAKNNKEKIIETFKKTIFPHLIVPRGDIASVQKIIQNKIEELLLINQ